MPKHILHIRERMGSLVYIKVPTAKVCLAVEGCGVLNLIISRLSCAGIGVFWLHSSKSRFPSVWCLWMVTGFGLVGNTWSIYI